MVEPGTSSDQNSRGLHGLRCARLREVARAAQLQPGTGPGHFAQLETRLDKKLTDHDQQIAAIRSAIRQLMHLSAPSAGRSSSPPIWRRSRSAGFEHGQICFDGVQNTERMYDCKPLPRADILIIDQHVRLGQERNEQRFDSQLSRI